MSESTSKRHLNVAAAAIFNQNGQVFLSRRPSFVDQGGRWEFPGGKRRPYETGFEALKRELFEELGIHVRRAQPLIRVPHDYGDYTVVLDVWAVHDFSGEPFGREGQVVRWVDVDDLWHYNFPEANLPIIRAAILPSYMMVTGEASSNDAFAESLEEALTEHQLKLVRVRAPELSMDVYAQRAEIAVELGRKHDARVLLGNRDKKVQPVVDLVESLDASGLYLTSNQLHGLKERPVATSRWLGSTVHNEQDLVMAEQLDCDFATLSPIRPTELCRDQTALGWHDLQEWVAPRRLPIYAMGGLEIDDIDHARGVGAQGIASQGFFWTVR